MSRFHPGLNQDEARKVVAEGEMAYTRSAMADARAEILPRPVPLYALDQRTFFWRFWLAPSRRFTKTTRGFEPPSTLLGLTGIVSPARKPGNAADLVDPF